MHASPSKIEIMESKRKRIRKRGEERGETGWKKGELWGEKKREEIDVLRKDKSLQCNFTGYFNIFIKSVFLL